MEQYDSVRFWDYVNGSYVKLTLKPGQSLRWDRFCWTDEGWERLAIEWHHKGNIVQCNHIDSGRDCDGPSGFYASYCCDINNLDSCEVIRETPDSKHIKTYFIPLWQQIQSEQYDDYAEAASY